MIKINHKWFLGILVVFSCGLDFSVQAADYYWSGASNGTWDTTSPVWSTVLTGDSPAAVATGSTNNVHFSAMGFPATHVTVSNIQRANNLYLDINGYWLDSGTIDFTGATNGIIQVNASGTISSVLKEFKSIQFNALNQTLTLTGGWSSTNAAQSLDQFVGASSVAIGKTSTLILAGGTYSTNANGSIRNCFGIGDMNESATGTSGVILQDGAQIDLAGNKLMIINNNGVFRMQGGLLNIKDTNTYNALTVGWTSAGRFIMTGGTIQQNANALTGIILGSGVNAVFDMQDGVINAKSFSIVGRQGAAITATLNISGGTTNVQGVGFGADFSGWLAGSGGLSTDGTANLNMSGGVLNVGKDGMVAYGTNNFKYNIVLSGGTIGTTGTTWKSTLNMTLSNADGGVTFNTDQNITLGGVLSSTGGFTKTGVGTLILQGANNYSGQTIVSAGLLKLDSTGSLTISLAALGSNAALSGAGSLELDGVININFSGATGSSWTIIGSNLLANTNFANANWLAGFTNDGSGLWTDISGNYQFNQSTGILNAIPEPSTYVLLGFGIASVLTLRGLRRNA
jgi:autotransporter-associated beta strand protein